MVKAGHRQGDVCRHRAGRVVPRPERLELRSAGSGRKLTLSAQIGRRVKCRGNVDLMAGVSAGDASGT